MSVVKVRLFWNEVYCSLFFSFVKRHVSAVCLANNLNGFITKHHNSSDKKTRDQTCTGKVPLLTKYTTDKEKELLNEKIMNEWKIIWMNER